MKNLIKMLICVGVVLLLSSCSKETPLVSPVLKPLAKGYLSCNINTDWQKVLVKKDSSASLINLNTTDAVTLTYEIKIREGSLEIFQNINGVLLGNIDTNYNIYVFTTNGKDAGNIILNNRKASKDVNCEYRFLGITN